MRKIVSKSTPVSVILNLILIINAIIVLYPALFTVSSSFTTSSSLAATSVIPFTNQGNHSIEIDCRTEDGQNLLTRQELLKVIEEKKDTYKNEMFALGKEINNGKVRLKIAQTEDSDFSAIQKKLEQDKQTMTDLKICSKMLADLEKEVSSSPFETNRDFDAETGFIRRSRYAFKVRQPSLYQYRRLLTAPDKLVKGETSVRGTNYKIWYLNTLKIACVNTIITVFVCTLAGYIFSRFSFTGRKQIMAGMIVLQMFPSFIGMVATYVILWKFNALNTLWGLVIVYSAGSIPFNSQLMKGYFDTMPRDIAEAAYIDGASPLVAFIKVILPAAKPQLVFLGLTSFTGPWMDYIFPRMILRSDDKKTLAVGLYEMISGRSNDNFTMFAAGAILVTVPFTILFMAGQKTLLLSLAGSSGKE